MKFLFVLFSTMLMSQAALSSQISCEEMVRYNVIDFLGAELQTNVSVNVTMVTDFSAHTVYNVNVELNLKDGMVGIPYSAQYKVLVRKEGLGACSIIDYVLEFEAQ